MLAVRTLGVAREKPGEVLSLLAIRFLPAEPPAGRIALVFSGGGQIELEVECIEAAVRDLGPAWATQCCPEHKLDETA